MTKSRGVADWGHYPPVNRNLIINGAMQVAQRGTSFTVGGYGLDRWKTFNAGGTHTLSRQSFDPGDSIEVGLDTYVRLVRASPSGIYYFSQRIEDVRKSDGATLTLSFYGKASSATTVPCRITQEFGSGGSSGVNTDQQNNNLTTSWQRFTMTFSMPSLSGKTIGAGSCFEPVFDIPPTTATIEITGVKLEVGDTATPFECRSYGDELALCQRYYQTLINKNTPLTPTGNGGNSSTGNLMLMSEMRSPPACSLVGTTTIFITGVSTTPTVINFTSITTKEISIQPRSTSAYGDSVCVHSIELSMDAEL